MTLFALIAVWWQKKSRVFSNKRLAVGCVCLVFAGTMGAVFSPGFAAALTRPLTWWTIPESILPMWPADKVIGRASPGLAIVVVVHAWWLAWRADRPLARQAIPLAVLSLLAITCRYYQCVSLLGVVGLTNYSSASSRTFRHERRLRWALIALAVLLFVPQLESYRSFLLTGRWPRQFVDPSTWETTGRVMLMRPESSSRWQTKELRQRFSLVIDDRWDLFAAEYPGYLQVCRDLSEFRSSRYLLSDGSWGGYRQWIDRWKPTLLVADSTDLDGIRRLSLSPDWKILGIDSRRTIFGSASEPANEKQSRIAGRLLSELEWPSPQFDGSFGNTIAATSNAQRTQVAEVLLTMRLPYAALRVMPETVSQGDLLTALCHFEVAHRVFRQTLTHTLIDQYRSIYHLRRLVERDRVPAKQLIRIARGLENLHEFETAVEFATQLVRQERSDLKQECQWATELISRCQSKISEESTELTSDPEAAVRRALRAGKRTAVENGLSSVNEKRRGYYLILAGAVETSPEDTYLELISSLNRSDFPDDLRGEALFYLGSLAIEVGDSPSAATAFSASIQADPTQALNSISRISLLNLQKSLR